MKLSNKNIVFFVCSRIVKTLNYSTADEEHSVFVRKLHYYIFFISSLRLTMLTCRPDDANHPSLSAALSPLSFLFGSYLSRFSLLCYTNMERVIFKSWASRSYIMVCPCLSIFVVSAATCIT